MRAGTTTEYHYGSTLACGQANFDYNFHSGTSCGIGVTSVVGSYAPNAWGLYDMHGNVHEWCLDSWDTIASYPAGPASDPYVSIGAYRIIRGGSWGAASYSCRSAYRSGYFPAFTNTIIGFRVVCAPLVY